MAEFETVRKKQPLHSHRQLAEEVGIPRTTLQHWQKRTQAIPMAGEVVSFFESPVGVAFLHRLVVAAQFTMTLMEPGGIRPVCLFLELSGLDKVVAASYGVQHQACASMEEAVVAFEQEEGARLSQAMSPKQVSLCQDETFHPQPCLVAIEPVSNFILLEQYAPNRTATEWTKEMKQALAGLPVKILQSTSDEGKGLCRHVKEDLGVHHSPDLLHIQAELVQATSVSLAAQTRQAQAGWDKARKAVERHQEEKAAYFQGLPRQGRPPAFDHRIEKARQEAAQTKQVLEDALALQAQAKQAIRQISTTYHPYDLESGVPKSAPEVAASLTGHFSLLEAIAKQANLPQRCGEKIQKAKKVMKDMVATIAFFFLMVQAKVEALELAPSVEQAVYEHLIPSLYLARVAKKVQPAQQQHLLRERSQHLITPLLARDGPFQGLDADDLKVIQQVGQECADLFQRSSSCVEGRNGHLALRHHCLHRLRTRKLKALTVVHNYFIRRPDGTTPAERFFGAKPKEGLFKMCFNEGVKLTDIFLGQTFSSGTQTCGALPSRPVRPIRFCLAGLPIGTKGIQPVVGAQVHAQPLVGGLSSASAAIAERRHIVSEGIQIQQGLAELAVDLLEGAQGAVNGLDQRRGPSGSIEAVGDGLPPGGVVFLQGPQVGDLLPDVGVSDHHVFLLGMAALLRQQDF